MAPVTEDSAGLRESDGRLVEGTPCQLTPVEVSYVRWLLLRRAPDLPVRPRQSGWSTAIATAFWLEAEGLEVGWLADHPGVEPVLPPDQE